MARSLKQLRKLTLMLYATGEIDDLEFILLYNYSESQDGYSHEIYNKFDLEDFDDAQCNTEFHFPKYHIQRLADALRLPQKTICTQGTVSSNIKGLCILLKRLSYPCQFTDMLPIFGRNPTEICLIFNQVLDIIHRNFQHLLNSWNQDMLQPHKLASYAEAIHQKGTLLENCFGFVDGTVFRIS